VRMQAVKTKVAHEEAPSLSRGLTRSHTVSLGVRKGEAAFAARRIDPDAHRI
jgi:hypothetical protein